MSKEQINRRFAESWTTASEGAIELEKKKDSSPAGNRTPVFRVTGGDTHHYTTEEVKMWGRQKGLIATPCNCSMRKKKKKLFPCGESNPGRGGESAES